jgi:hypothetical protein
MRVSGFRVNRHESSETTGGSLVSQNRTIKLRWSRQRRSPTTSAASFPRRFQVTTAVAADEVVVSIGTDDAMTLTLDDHLTVVDITH